MDGDRERRESLSAPCCLPPVLFSLCVCLRALDPPAAMGNRCLTPMATLR